MKNIVIREKSRKMSRGGYDAPRSNRRITLDDGQLFSGYIYIYKKTDYRKPRIKLFLFKVVGQSMSRRDLLLLASWEIGSLLSVHFKKSIAARKLID